MSSLLDEISVLKKRMFLVPKHVEQLDSWHTDWLLNAPKGEERHVLVVYEEGRIVLRECILGAEEAQRRYEDHKPDAVLMTFGRK